MAFHLGIRPAFLVLSVPCPQQRHLSLRRCKVEAAAGTEKLQRSDWREKASPIKPGSSYPAKEFCSKCGLCDTYYIAHVKDSCAFIGDGEPLE